MTPLLLLIASDSPRASKVHRALDETGYRVCLEANQPVDLLVLASGAGPVEQCRAVPVFERTPMLVWLERPGDVGSVLRKGADDCVADTADLSEVLARIEALVPMLADPPSLYAEWRKLVVAHGCSGKIAHDARYIAALQLHELTRFLTFNVADFARFPGITILDPNAIASPRSP